MAPSASKALCLGSLMPKAPTLMVMLGFVALTQQYAPRILILKAALHEGIEKGPSCPATSCLALFGCHVARARHVC